MRSMTHVHSDAMPKHQTLEIRCKQRQKLPLTTATSSRAYVTNSGRIFSNDCTCAVVTYTSPLRHHLPVRESYKKTSPVYGSHKMAVLNSNCHAHNVMLLGHSIRSCFQH